MRTKLKDYLVTISHDIYSSIEIIETTYDEFIWKNCIGDDFKIYDEIPKVNYYTDQEMKHGDSVYGSAVEELSGILSSNSDYISYLLVGDGGTGKSSLCFSLYSKLKENSSCIPFLISSEAIRNYVEDTNYIPDSINGLYDLYEIQSKCNQEVGILDRKKFDISLCSGNIVIIVDGLDEFPSIFGDKFDTETLLSSISDSHSQLGKSRILITSRDTKFVETEKFDNLHIKKYDLLGFNESDCKKYIRKRFKGKVEELEVIVNMIVAILRENTFELDDRVTPFILVQICNIYESSVDVQDFNDFFSKKNLPFKCLNTFTDHLVYGTFRREKNRHKFPISALEMLNLFWDFTAKYGNKWPLDKVIEDVGLLYDEKVDLIVRCIKINSLLSLSGSYISVKNDFTVTYLKTLYFINTLVPGPISRDDVALFSKLRYDSNEFNDLKSYLIKENIDISLLFPPSLNFLKAEINKATSKPYRSQLINSIENLFHLALLASKKFDKDNATKYFKDFFGSDSASNTIENCYIKGDIPPLDFSFLIITKSKFTNYPKFLNGKFDNANFMYTEFDKCNNVDIRNENFLLAKFDRKTCKLGDLEDAINSISESIEKENELIEDECRKFFSSFRKGIYFRDNNRQHIKFSNVVSGLSKRNFDSLIKEKYIEISSEKEVDVFYKIAAHFEDSVKELMTNSLIDDLMGKFIIHVRK